MKEGPKETPLDVLDVFDISQRKEDFAGNITGLYNTMIQFDPNEAYLYLGKLHGLFHKYSLTSLLKYSHKHHRF